MSQTNQDSVVARFEKNARDEVWVSVSEYQGKPLINFRVHYKDKDGEWRPGKQGLAFGVDKYRDLAQAVIELGKRLQEDGLIPKQ